MSSDTAIMLSARDRAIVHRVLQPFGDRIERVAVFGSRALGRATPASDIDLVVYGDLDDPTIARIWSIFDESSLAVTVDVVRYESLGAGSFRSHIDRYARTLFTPDDLRAAA